MTGCSNESGEYSVNNLNQQYIFYIALSSIENVAPLPRPHTRTHTHTRFQPNYIIICAFSMQTSQAKTLDEQSGCEIPLMVHVYTRQ